MKSNPLAPDCLLFLLVAGLLIPAACPSVYWLDTGEFLAAFTCLGLPHSPSFPVYVLSTRPALFIPLGDAASRGNVSGAIWGALLALGMFRLIRMFLRSPDSAPGRTLAFVLAAASVLNPLVMYQCLKAEVYTLNLLFNVWALVLSLRTLDPHCPDPVRKWTLTAGFLCLGMGTHMLLTAQFIPAILFIGLFSMKRLARANILAPLILVLLFGSVYLYLPIRSARNPGIDLGNPEHAMTFINAVTRKGSVERFFGNPADELIRNIPRYYRLTGEQLTHGIWFLAVPGVILLTQRRPAASCALLIAGSVNVFLTLLNRNFNANPDTGPAYLMGSTLVLILFGGITLDRMSPTRVIPTARFRAAAAIPALVATLIVAGWAWTGQTRFNLEDDFSASTVGRAAMDRCEPDAVIFTGFYSNIRFVMSYLQIGERYRDDIELVDRGEATYWPGGLEKLIQRYPDSVAALPSERMREAVRYLAPRGTRHSGWIPRSLARDIILNYLAHLSRSLERTRPVYWIPSEDDFLLNRRFAGEGIFLRLTGDPPRPGNAVPDSGIRSLYSERIRLNTSDFRGTFGSRVLVELLSNTGNTLETSGFTEAAVSLYDQALEIDPDNAIVLNRLRNLQGVIGAPIPL